MSNKRSHDKFQISPPGFHEQKQKQPRYDRPSQPLLMHKHNQGQSNQQHNQKPSLRQSNAYQQRMALLTQLSSEVENNPGFLREIAHATDEDVATATSHLVELLNSKKTTLKAMFPIDAVSEIESLELPTIVGDSGQSPQSLPQLPPISSPELADVPFVHRAKVTELSRTTGKEVDYERLEFLGDAYIEIIASRLIFHQYPTITAGKLAALREKLVCNETLAELALAYKFDERALVPKEYLAAGNDKRKLWVKLLGDVFEAYVAAVIVSDPKDGFSVTERWLTALWKRKLPLEDEEAPLIPTAKVLLAQKIHGTPPIKIEYRQEKEPQSVPGRVIYAIGVYLSGWGWETQRLGIGTAFNKNEAGIRAAMEALNNPLTAQISAIKREFDEKVKVERARDGGGDPAVIKMLEVQYKGIPKL